MSKRVYKFTSAHYDICNLQNKRLKLSTVDDLNDPFDLNANSSKGKLPKRLTSSSMASVPSNGLHIPNNAWAGPSKKSYCCAATSGQEKHSTASGTCSPT